MQLISVTTQHAYCLVCLYVTVITVCPSVSHVWPPAKWPFPSRAAEQIHTQKHKHPQHAVISITITNCLTPMCLCMEVLLVEVDLME